MINAFVALDEAKLENGCLWVLKGSHKLGRIDHGKVGAQTGVEQKRMDTLIERMELVPVMMKPGSVLLFHGNTLHSSSANESDRHRRSFIMCYNAVSNPQIKPDGVVEVRPTCPVGDDRLILG